MSEFRLSPEAEAELDGIWIHIARESGSADIATVVESIAADAMPPPSKICPATCIAPPSTRCSI